MIKLKNSYAELPERFYERVRPENFQAPELLLFNSALSDEMGFELSEKDDVARVFSGQDLLPGSEPIAQAYAGFQFGHPVPQLGDGRAHLLGELNGFDIQLKGSGRTSFSRRGDGRSALGPVIREFLVSEGMHALGVPTTRSLCIVTTGEQVLRQNGPEPGGILTRVAESHVRVGTFQYFSFQDDHEALEILTDYTIRRHYSEIQSTQLSGRCLELIRSFADRQGDLVAQWYALGFIHGVMNTDNCSMAGITIDYGPCAFMDEFVFQKVFSSIDHQGRYAYGNQMPILEWNILRFAECLLPLIADDPETASSKVKEVLNEILPSFPKRVFRAFARKLGLKDFQSGDEAIIREFLEYLEENSLDFTLSFAHLEALYGGETKFYPNDAKRSAFLEKWKDRGPDLSQVNAVNPRLIPRNHQIERVIQQANQGNYGPLEEMWEVLKTPFKASDEHLSFMDPPRPDERVRQTFCGT